MDSIRRIGYREQGRRQGLVQVREGVSLTQGELIGLAMADKKGGKCEPIKLVAETGVGKPELRGN